MENLNKSLTVRILRIIMPIVGIICIVVFSPWDGIWAWITPLPDTVQEQVDDAIGHGLDGIIVYVDEAGQPPAFYTSGWKDRDNQIPADPQSFFKIAVSASYMMLWLSPNWSMTTACLWMIRSQITFRNLWEGLKMPIRLP